MWFGGGTDFVAVYGRKRRAIIAELSSGQRFARLVLTDQDEGLADELTRRIGRASA